MNPQLFGLGKEGNQKVDLQKGFSPADGNTPFITPETFVTKGLL